MSAGGSSGGAATAVSMNLVPCSDGSDMMGSCRIPAAFTNLYGYRPSPGIIPELREKSDVRKIPILSTIGVISRTPKDLCYYMNCIAGKDQNDESSIDINYSFIKIGNLKIPNIFKIGWLNNLCEKYDFENELAILYSSGPTGKPKCICHRAGGVLIQHKKEHQLHCDIKEGDNVFYFTTCGWMMWNWLISVLASKASIVLFDGSPTFKTVSYTHLTLPTNREV